MEKSRGGKRENAGRKVGFKGENNRRKSTITLPVDLWEWLNDQPLSQSKEIEKLILLAKSDKRI